VKGTLVPICSLHFTNPAHYIHFYQFSDITDFTNPI
jgi:hypothetical protein